MKFLWPEMLWLLLTVPALVAAYFFLLRRKKQAALRYASLSMVKEAMGAGQRFRRHIPPLLFLVALIVMIVAIARPAAVAAKDTTPMRTFEGCSATKALAAACAAEIRLGCTSMARMLPETSMARMMVWCWDGKVMTAAGRAIARIITVSAIRKSKAGM